MKDDTFTRLAILQDLLSITRPLKEISTDLSALEWDFVGEGISLKRKHIADALRRYLGGNLSAEEIEVWANLIESREDISFEASYESEISEMIYTLANPLLTQPLDKEFAALLLKRMQPA